MAATESSFMLKRTDHTGFTVHSIKDSIDFWVNGLGFELRDVTEYPAGPFLDNVVGVEGAELTSAKLSGAGYTIELLEYRRPQSRTALKPRSCDVGSVHIAFEVDNLDAVLSRVARFNWKAVGIPQTVSEGVRAGTRLIYVRGPDGVTVEFIETSRSSPSP